MAYITAVEAGNDKKTWDFLFLGESDTVKFLLKNGANINVIDRLGDTMIMLAIKQGTQSINQSIETLFNEQCRKNQCEMYKSDNWDTHFKKCYIKIIVKW